MLNGKIAVITGAGAGIGASTAFSFAREHIKGIAVIDYNYDSASQTAQKLTELGVDAIPIKCNVGNAEEVSAAAKQVIDHFGRVDILVNNAGITRDCMFHKMSLQQFSDVINVNLFGAVYWTHELINLMREQGYGRIVNISSASARGIVGQTNYSASKSALIGFTRSLAKESGKKGITVNCVAPGATMTDMYLQVPEQVMSDMVRSNPMNRLGKPEEIADVIAFVASERAAYLNGQWILVNGGK